LGRMPTQQNDDRIALLQGTLDLLIRAKWGVSENNRKARFYSLTPKGREQLTEKASEWRRLARAMGLILDADSGLQREEA